MKSNPKLLYVEDEIDLGNVTKQYLETQGFEVDWSTDSEDAYARFSTNPTSYNLAIIDVQLPDMNGFELAQRLLALDKQVYFLFLTARKEKKDKILGLGIGAADYITKPFDIDELVLRIRNIIRRQDRTPPDEDRLTLTDEEVVRMGDVLLNTKMLSLTVGSADPVTLTLREVELFTYFYKNSNQVVSREDLLVSIWGENDYFLGRSLDVFISRIRKRVSDSRYLKIENIYGVGFICRVLG